jgi:DNA processing protein
MDGLFFFKRTKGANHDSASDDGELIAALRLARSAGIGPILWRRLVARFGTAAAALKAWPDLARSAGARPARVCSLRDAESELDRLQRLGGRLLVLGTPDYPAALAEIADAPPVLALRGDLCALSRAPVAMVGARNASLNGRRLAEHLAQQLAEQGRVVVSGLARGIDTAAHCGALAGAGDGSATVAVLAGGIDQPYPPENCELLERVVERGAAISEVALGVAPMARHFPRRNRIIAGLCQGVVVIEAALRSGSLITARLANEQGREVLAVPGSPLDERCRGGNALLRQGATLVEDIADILAALPAAQTPVPRTAPIGPAMPRPGKRPAIPSLPDGAYAAVLGLLAASPTQVDQLLRACDLPATAVTEILLDLELSGRLERHAGNAVSLT